MSRYRALKIVCDEPECGLSAYIVADTRKGAAVIAIGHGWRVGRARDLCPACVEARDGEGMRCPSDDRVVAWVCGVVLAAASWWLAFHLVAGVMRGAG